MAGTQIAFTYIYFFSAHQPQHCLPVCNSRQKVVQFGGKVSMHPPLGKLTFQKNVHLIKTGLPGYTCNTTGMFNITLQFACI